MQSETNEEYAYPLELRPTLVRNKNLDSSPATEHKLCRLSILRRNFWVSQTFIVSDVINWRNQFLEGAKFHLCKLIVKSIKENT